jgi:DnaJ-class molecular chaperone
MGCLEEGYMTEPFKEYCGNCGALWTTTINTKEHLSNNFCCASPFYQNSEYCTTCMGTGGMETAICPECKGTGEKPE